MGEPLYPCVRPRAGLGLAGYLCLALVGAAALAPPAQAATIQSVQKGAFTLGSATCTVDVTAPQFNPVTRNRSFLVFSQRNDGSWAGRAKVAGRILPGGTTLRFQRNQCAGGAPDIQIHWKVAEFSSGVTVQHGEAVMTSTTINVPIAAINLASSFPLATLRNAGGDFDHDDWLRAELTSATNLRLNQRSNSGWAWWQVVEFTGADVQSGNLSFVAGATSRNAALTAVDTAKSWLIYSYATGSTNPRIWRGLVRGRITSSTNLNFDRDVTGTAIDTLTWYLVEFTDGTTVRHGNMNFPSGTADQTATLTPAVSPAWSIAAGGYMQIGGKSPYVANDIPGVSWFTQEVTSPTQLELRRVFTGASADLGWFVVAFTRKIYYSIGTETNPLFTGPGNTGSATAGVMTLDKAAANNIGVGDEVRVGASARRYYISGRISSTQFRIQDSGAGGGTPGDTNINFGPSASLEIYRAFNLVSDAELRSSDADHLGTADLVTNGFQLNWTCYNDGPINDTATIDGYTTG